METKAATDVFDIIIIDSTSWEAVHDLLLGIYQTICIDTHYITTGVSAEEAHGMHCPVAEALPVYGM